MKAKTAVLIVAALVLSLMFVFQPEAQVPSAAVTGDHCPRSLMVRGRGNTTGTGDVAFTGTVSGQSNLKTYIYSVQVINTGATATLITLKDGSAGSTLGTTIAPAGAGSNIYFAIPLVTTANTALYFAAASASTTVYGEAQGCKGT